MLLFNYIGYNPGRFQKQKAYCVSGTKCRMGYILSLTDSLFPCKYGALRSFRYARSEFAWFEPHAVRMQKQN